MKSLTKQLPHRKISTLLSSRNEMPNQYTRKVFHLISELFSVVEFLFWPRGWCYMLREWKIGRAGSDQTFVRRQHKSKDPPFDSPLMQGAKWYAAWYILGNCRNKGRREEVWRVGWKVTQTTTRPFPRKQNLKAKDHWSFLLITSIHSQVSSKSETCPKCEKRPVTPPTSLKKTQPIKSWDLCALERLVRLFLSSSGH